MIVPRGCLISRLMVSAFALIAGAQSVEASEADAVPGRPKEPLVYHIDPTAVEKTIDVGIHGQFLEHIFNSVHGGLWGDLIRNPSLEPNGGTSLWKIDGETVTLTRPATNQPLKLGNADWGDYTLELEARRDEGSEGFLVMFRVAHGRHYWANFGGWSNREHGMEKSGRSLGVAKIPGSIEAGRWYKVRIVCEGPQHQVYLDGKKLFDFRDEREPYLRGGIGLNTWNTRASFRNVRVTSADGKVLYEGLPSADSFVNPPAYWDKTGTDGRLALDTQHPLNTDVAAILACDREGGEFGLQQQPLNLQQGDTYRGSLYLRSDQGATAAVRFQTKQGASLFERQFKDLPQEWTKYEFDYPCEQSAPDAVFQVVAKGRGAVVVDQINVFPQSALDLGGFRPDLLRAIAALKPASIRYPGGCFASGYRWKDAIGPREKRVYYPAVIWADRDPSQFGTDEFMLLCEKVGAEPIIPVNMHRGVQEALDWLEYCNGPADSPWGKVRAANGHPEPYNVKIWEIDNETWGMGPERYAEVVETFAPAMKAKDPSIVIAACGGYGYDDGKGSTDGWNRRLLDAAAKHIDLLSIHYYNGIAYPQDFVKDPRRYESYIRDEVMPLIAASANPDMRVYCSEWGQTNIDWRSGLYTAGLLNGFERLGEEMPLTCPAVWLQAVSAKNGYAPRWGSASILYDHRRWFPAPAYVVQRFWRDNFAPHLLKMDGPTEPLNAVATASADGRTLFFKTVNPYDRETAVEVRVGNGFAVNEATLEIIAPGELDARNALDQPDRIVPVAGVVETEGQVVRFRAPPYSAAVLRVR